MPSPSRAAPSPFWSRCSSSPRSSWPPAPGWPSSSTDAPSARGGPSGRVGSASEPEAKGGAGGRSDTCRKIVEGSASTGARPAEEEVSDHLLERTPPMRRIFPVAAVLALALTTAACGSDDADTAAASSAPMTTSAAPSPSPSESMATADIVDTAVAAGNFTTLTAALPAAGLVDTLKGAGPFTVFAPTDDAFAKLPAGTVDTLLKDPKGDLTQILTYHVVPGKVMAADVVKLDGQKVKTVQGGELTIGVDGDKVTLTDAAGNTVNVTMTDVEASNGVIHVIDGVLMPK